MPYLCRPVSAKKPYDDWQKSPIIGPKRRVYIKRDLYKRPTKEK